MLSTLWIHGYVFQVYVHLSQLTQNTCTQMHTAKTVNNNYGDLSIRVFSGRKEPTNEDKRLATNGNYKFIIVHLCLLPFA